MRTIDAIQAINDATMLAAALAPLVQRAVASGAAEISDADVEAARAALGTRIGELDAAIAAAKTQQGGA